MKEVLSKYAIPFSPEFLSEFKGSADVFVPVSKEDEYLKRHDIEIRRLPNGISLIGATRNVDDIATAHIELYFPSGAYHEPRNQRGIYHLLEHVVFNKPHNVARESEAYYNAETSPGGIKILLDGTATLDVLSYGVWPVIDVALDEVLHFPQITQDELDTEKKITLNEKSERDGTPKFLRPKLLNQQVFDDQNPVNYQPEGSPETLAPITVADAQDAHRRVFIPKGLVGYVFTQGDPRVTSRVLDMLEARLSEMPDPGLDPQRVKKDLYSEVNPNFKQGNTYSLDYGINDGQVFVHYAWLVPSVEYSVAAFATGRVLEIIERKLHAFARKTGLAYSTDTFMQSGYNVTAAGLVLSIPNEKDPEDFSSKIYPIVRREVLGAFTAKEVSHIDKTTHDRSAAIPTTVENRIDAAINGLYSYGRIVDPDRVRRLHQMITPDDVRKAIEQFTSVDPATIIIGDLS